MAGETETGSQGYCDLVMKGGITSGLVYPNAVLALARKYRFKNIGGTSAGAIAAAICAAAALGERRRALEAACHSKPHIGMAGLELVAGQLTRRGFIYGLFQPAWNGRAAYRLIVALAAKPGRARVALEVLLALVRMAPFSMLLTLLLLLGLGYGIDGVGGLVAALLPALVCALAVGGWRSIQALGAAAASNFLGLCPGTRQPGFSTPALTEWMHETIRQVAGLEDPDGRPVVFRDLWDAPRYAGEPEGPRTLDLQIITTNVSHSEPRTIPFVQGRLWFREDEFLRLFPAPVVAWMKAHAPCHYPRANPIFYELPKDGALPIVVAARMSLSFPLLISAVPLYELDWQRLRAEGRAHPRAGLHDRPRFVESVDALALGGAEDGALIDIDACPISENDFRVCWFTDGGAASNFPVHLFDAPLPRWPTFAIDLVYPDQNPPPEQVVTLPRSTREGRAPRYRSITGKGGLADLSSFLFAIIATMQNWRDLLQARAPGHRDRVVRIALAADEGGMKLDMPGEVLRRVAGKGAKAGETLVEDFDFDAHFWIRYRNAASAIERFTITFAEGLAPPLTDANRHAYARMWSGAPSGEPYGFTAVQADEALRRLQKICAEARTWSTAAQDLTEGAPTPLPQARIVPIF